MTDFFLAMAGVLLLMALIAGLVSIAFGYFLLSIIGRATGKMMRGPGTAFVLGLPLAYSFSLIQAKSQTAFLLALAALPCLGSITWQSRAAQGG